MNHPQSRWRPAVYASGHRYSGYLAINCSWNGIFIRKSVIYGLADWSMYKSTGYSTEIVQSMLSAWWFRRNTALARMRALEIAYRSISPEDEASREWARVQGHRLAVSIRVISYVHKLVPELISSIRDRCGYYRLNDNRIQVQEHTRGCILRLRQINQANANEC